MYCRANQEFRMGDEPLYKSEHLKQVLRSFLPSLTTNERTVLRLKFWENCSRNEIAKRTKQSPKTVDRTIENAIVFLRHAFIVRLLANDRSNTQISSDPSSLVA